MRLRLTPSSRAASATVNVLIGTPPARRTVWFGPRSPGQIWPQRREQRWPRAETPTRPRGPSPAYLLPESGYPSPDRRQVGVQLRGNLLEGLPFRAQPPRPVLPLPVGPGPARVRAEAPVRPGDFGPDR